MADSFKSCGPSRAYCGAMRGWSDVSDRGALQRRTLRVLVGAQVFAALGASGAAAGALLALDITGSESLASLPLAFIVVGSSAAVVPISLVFRRAGRRSGLVLALGTAAVGAGGVVAAGVLASFSLLCAASAVFGAGNTAVMLARYAAADLSAQEARGRAIGRVVFAATFGAVAGPNLLAPAGAAATAVGLPELTGLYLVSAVAFSIAAVVLFVLLRPDPLQIAAALDSGPTLEVSPRRARGPALRRLLSAPAATTGLATIVVANFVMVAVMSMAPVHMHAEGHDLEFVGLVVSLHVAGMFGPSPLTGRLTDRLGPIPVAAASALLLMVAGAVSAAAGADAFTFTVGLVVLGVGWNAGLVAGSTLLASAVPVAHRPRVEAFGELSMGVAAASATAVAGPVVGVAGYATLAVAGAVAAAALSPFLVAVARRGLPAEAVPANRLLAG